MSAPRLPERKRSSHARTPQQQAHVKATNAVQDLRQDASVLATKLQEQRPALQQALQDELVLQQMLAANPELAELLQADKIEQLVTALQSPQDLRKFFDAHPQLGDLTKQRQTVMNLRQQLQTLRQQQMRNLLPHTSPENLQAARHFLSQLATNPAMTVSQLQPQWPAQVAAGSTHHPSLPPTPNFPQHTQPGSNTASLPPSLSGSGPIPGLIASHNTALPLQPNPTTQPPQSPASAMSLTQPGLLAQAPSKISIADKNRNTHAGHPPTVQFNTTEYQFSTATAAQSLKPVQRLDSVAKTVQGTGQATSSAMVDEPAWTKQHNPSSMSCMVATNRDACCQDPGVSGSGIYHSHNHHHHRGSNPWHGYHNTRLGQPTTELDSPHHAAYGLNPMAQGNLNQGSYGHEHHHRGNGEHDRGYSGNVYWDTGYRYGYSDGGQDSHGVRPKARVLDPKSYYEPVEPSDWAPSPVEHCMYLYSRAYFWPMDVLFPPLWFCLGALLCGLKVLPLWALLLLLPLCFVGGIELLVVQGAGVSRKQLALSKTVPSFVVSLEVVTLLVAAARLAPVLLYGGTWLAIQAGALLLVVLAGILLHWWAATADPGFVDGLKCEEAAPLEGSVHVSVCAHLPECWTCHVPRPLRSKHCVVCKRCVHRFDHHCNMLPNCVGAGNQASFTAFVFAVLLAMVLFLKLSWQYSWLRFAALAEQRHTGSTWGTWMLVLQATSRATPEVLLLQLLFIPIIVGVAFLAARCTLLVAGNLTTNELINRARYPYLNHEVAGFCNRFDWGPWRNCCQFWASQKRRDWWSEFEAGDKAMRSKEMTMITTLSVTYYLRLWDYNFHKVNERLQKQREERRDRRLQQALARLHEDMD